MSRLRALAKGFLAVVRKSLPVCLGIAVVLNLVLTIGLAQLMLGSASVELVTKGRFFEYGLVSRAAALSSETSSLQDDIESLQADVESVRSDLDSVTDEGIGEVQTALEEIQSKLDDLEFDHGRRLDDLDSQINLMRY